MLDKVIDIVKEASKIMLDTNFEVNNKDGVANIVTSNDIKVQLFLKDKLLALLPNSSFYGEELDSKDLSSDYVWIVDPIDGTTNYARNMGVSAISVALYNKDNIILGVVYNPFLNLLFKAKLNEGAYLNGKPIHVSNKNFNEAILYTAFSAYDKTKSHICFDIASEAIQKVNDLRRTGSAACELSNVARGVGDVFFEYKLSPWDYAASSLIIKEAGGIITDQFGNALQFVSPTGILAANTKENHSKMLEIVKKHYK